MYVYIYIYMCIYIYTNIIYIRIYIYTYICIFRHTWQEKLGIFRYQISMIRYEYHLSSAKRFQFTNSKMAIEIVDLPSYKNAADVPIGHSCQP